jgi:hypothetical protein
MALPKRHRSGAVDRKPPPAHLYELSTYGAFVMRLDSLVDNVIPAQQEMCDNYTSWNLRIMVLACYHLTDTVAVSSDVNKASTSRQRQTVRDRGEAVFRGKGQGVSYSRQDETRKGTSCSKQAERRQR